MEDFPQPKPYSLERLTERHSVAAFDCQNTYLNDFLKTKALAEAKEDLSQTFVLRDRSLPASESIVEYFTLRADSVTYPREDRRGSIFFPVVELSCLARHIKCWGEGIGGILLEEAFEEVALASKHIGIGGIHLAFTDEGKRLYEAYGFGAHPYGEYLLMISIRDVRAALMLLG